MLRVISAELFEAVGGRPVQYISVAASDAISLGSLWRYSPATC